MKRAIAATAITLSVIGGAAIVGRLDRTVPAPTTAHVQPAASVHAIPPTPTKEAEKDCATCKSTNSPVASAPTTLSIQPPAHASIKTATVSVQPSGFLMRARTANSAHTSRATVSALPSATEDPYRDSMVPGGSKWTTSNDIDASANADAISGNPTTVARTQQAVPATAISANRAVMPSAASSTTTSDPRCLTIAPDFQQDCATANRWLDDIGTKYVAQMQRHYRWLTAAAVGDWRVNGCAPSPCDANGTGRIQPPDYFGAQGYDSPLGTCHSSTPTALHYEAACGGKDEAHGCAAARAVSTQLALGGVVEDDGKVHGLVRWAGDGLFYEGTITDVACLNGCAVEFDHPCSLPSPLAIFFTYRGAMQTNGKSTVVYSWWYGEDPRAPGPWAAGWMAEEMP